ncbi:MAG: hypothetical protein FWD61_18805 [Phycisphaerales bacterium]|nr:hypothetical protein [Phycisphaerales bacterium]
MSRKLWKEVALIGCIAAAGTMFGTQAMAADVGIVSQLKVLSENPSQKYVCEDVSSPEAWKKTYIKDGMTDEQKAIAVWKTVVRYRSQDNPPNEYLSGDNVHDPIKTFNVYGYGMCCCASSNVEGLARYIGMPAQGRQITLHSVPEVWYDGAWHLLDGSLMSYFRNAEGKIASVNEINKSIRDWRQENPGQLADDKARREFSKNNGWKNGPKVLATVNNDFQTYDENGVNGAGWHGWWSNIGEYGKISDAKNAFGWAPDFSGQKTYGVFDYGATMGYKVNVQLREGEKITRNWSHKGLHVNMSEAGLPGAANPKGSLKFQRTLGDMAPGRMGNGVSEYDVPLENGVFRSGALVVDNLQTKSEGAASAVAVKDASKDGVLIIRRPTSFIYMKGELALSPVVAAGGSVAVSISQNHGMDWKEVAKFDKTGDQKIDMTKFVFRKYDYQLKIVMTGAGTGLNALKMTDDIQHSQAVLPLILEGENKITFSAGEPEGTITYEGKVAPNDRNLSYLDYHPVLENLAEEKMLVQGGGRGTAVFTMKTPGDITRLRIGAHYRCRDYDAAYTSPTGKIRDYWDIEASFDKGATWKKVDQLNRGQPASSKYVVFSDVTPNSREMQVRFTGVQGNTTCMFDLRMDTDYKEPTGGFKPVKITYVWTEGGTEKTDSHICSTPTDTWTIKCGPNTVAKSYTMELVK